MELVIQLYLYSTENEPDPYKKRAKEIRQIEIDECFLRNLHHPLIRCLHILCETVQTKLYYQKLSQEYQQEMKCIFIVHGKQPTYADIVRYIDKNIPENRIVCIQNSDIYIDHTMKKKFLESNVSINTFIALTRHEHTEENHPVCSINTCPLIWNYMGSHDTFIFRTPVPKNFPFETLNYHQNVYGGETVFMKAWKDSGKVLYNPCFDIRIFHRHMNRISFEQYPTIADGYLCNVSPVAPKDRPDIAKSLQTLFKD